MKKLLLVCLLFVGMVSFIPFTATTAKATTSDSITIDKNAGTWEIQFEQNDATSELTAGCWANVYYNGEYCCHFWGIDCEAAAHAACDFIRSSGGTCPIGY